jgi:hypothetical protein
LAVNGTQQIALFDDTDDSAGVEITHSEGQMLGSNSR